MTHEDAEFTLFTYTYRLHISNFHIIDIFLLEGAYNFSSTLLVPRHT